MPPLTGSWEQRTDRTFRTGPGSAYPPVPVSAVIIRSIRATPRIHLDLYSDQQDADVERLLSLGASLVEWSGPS